MPAKGHHLFHLDTDFHWTKMTHYASGTLGVTGTVLYVQLDAMHMEVKARATIDNAHGCLAAPRSSIDPSERSERALHPTTQRGVSRIFVGLP